MKKKCMAVGGTAKKPASMEEQLAGIRGKVRPGYQAGGTVYRSGNSFTDQQIGEPMKGIASAGMSGQVDNMLDRTKAMPNSIASPPQYGGSVIPAQTGQQAMQAATNFGMPPAGTAPAATSQTISTGDYSTGPRQGGFVDEYGKPRTTPAQDAQAEADARQAEIAKRSKEQVDNIASMKGLSDRQRVAAVSGIATNAGQSGVGTDIAGALGVPMNQLSNKQQLRVSQAQYGVDMQEDGLTQPARRGYRRGYAGGGIVDKLIRVVEKVLPPSNNEKYEPGIQSRAAEDPARHGRAEALNPRTQTALSDTPPAGGFQEEAERRRKQMKEAMNYEAGGMVESEDEDESEDKNKCSIEISIDIPVGDKKVKAKNADAADYACGGKVKKRGMAGGGMVRFSGKGGPRDDQIPVKVAGQEINVSNGENAVILPAKTAANPAALYAIGGIIQATNDGRKPKMGMENGGKYARGGIVGGNLSSSGSYVNEDDISGVENLKRAMATYARPFQAVGQVFTDSARAQQEGVSYQDIQQRKPVQQSAPYSNEGRPSAMDNYALTPVGPAGQGITAGVAQPSGAVVKDGMTTTQMGAGFDPTKIQIAPGYGMATNAAGKTIAAGNAEYVGADGRPTSRWTDTQQYKDAIARNEADKLRLAEMQAQRLGADPMAVQKASQGIAGGVLAARAQEAGLQRNAQIQSLVAKAAAEPDQGKRQQFIDAALAMQGKDNKQEKNLQVVDLGSESAPDGMGGVKAIPRGQALYDASTKQWVPMASGSVQQTSFSKSDVDSAIKAGASKETVAARIKSMGMNPKDYGL